MHKEISITPSQKPRHESTNTVQIARPIQQKNLDILRLCFELRSVRMKDEYKM